MAETIDYTALFGVEAQGAEEQEAADPAADAEEREGENEQEVTDPAESEEADGEEPPENEEISESGTGGQSRTENARYAAARRKAEAERDAEIQRIREESKREMDAFYADSGFANPYTGQPIKSKEEYEAYRKQFVEEKKRGFMQSNGMDEEAYGKFVESLPEVAEARRVKEEAEQEKLEARKAAADARIAEEIKEIGALDPSIKSLADLPKMPTYARFYELVRDNSLNLVDAFKLANMETLTQSAAAGAKQAAMNSIQGRQHMERTQQRGAGAVNVPADVMEEYRKLLPNATDEEIRADYTKRHSRG